MPLTRYVLSEDAAQALIDTSIAAAAGLSQFPDRIDPAIPARLASTTTTAVLVANTVYLYRFRVARPMTVANAIIMNGATVAGNVALGIYTESGGTWTLVASTPETAQAGTSTEQEIAFSTPYEVVPGVDYWSAFGGTNATATLLRLGQVVGIGDVKNDVLLKAGVYSSGLPATITTPVAATILFWHAFTTA